MKAAFMMLSYSEIFNAIYKSLGLWYSIVIGPWKQMGIHTNLAAIPKVLSTRKRHQKIQSPPHTGSHKQFLHMWWSRYTHHQNEVFPPSLNIRHTQSSPEITKNPTNQEQNKKPNSYLLSQQLESGSYFTHNYFY